MLTQMHRTFYTEHDARHCSRLRVPIFQLQMLWVDMGRYQYFQLFRLPRLDVMLTLQLKHHYADMFHLARFELPSLVAAGVCCFILCGGLAKSGCFIHD